MRSLHVSPASISKAIGYLENQALIKRERDPHSRAERYAVEDDVVFQSVMASARNQTEIAEACTTGAQKLGATTPAGARLENTSQFLFHVMEDLVRSAEYWHKIYFTRPQETPETG
ncbi:hypothetical protein [Streptomyces sp. NPDC018031]|uniref:hypothetical protein n=1 Tax=Streptomyces sp. NPDC018031 TaxID=3365033 RepID=UPI00379F5279